MTTPGNNEEAKGPPPDIRDGAGVVLVRAQLMLSAYAPLFAILAVRFQGTTLRWVCGGLAIVGVLHLIISLWVAPHLVSSRPFPVSEVRDASSEVAGFLATYLLPFVTVPSPSRADIIGYVIFAVIVVAIFVRSNLAQVNPTLYLLGRRVVSITVNGRDLYLVCRRIPRAPSTIHGCSFAGLIIREGG
jgi:hypothetical protein